jgi:hypothetical protein
MNPPEGVVPVAPPAGMVPVPQAGAAPPSDPNSVKLPPMQLPGPLKAASSGIGVATDYFTAGLLAPPNALARDIHHIAQEHVPLDQILKHDKTAFPNLANIRRTIEQHGIGPTAAHKIAGDEGLTTPGPGAFLQGAPGWVKAGVEIGEGFLAPTGEITGPIAALAARAGGMAALKIGEAAAHAAPKTTEALQTMKEGMAPYSGLRRAAIKAGVDPNKAEQAGRTYKNAESIAKASAGKLSEKIFGGLTKAEKIEVERLSENYGPKGAVNPPRLADPDGKLWFRSKVLRNEYHQTTDDLIKQGHLRDAATPGKAPIASDPHTYTYRGGDVYNHSNLTPEEEEAFKAAGGAPASKTGTGIGLGQTRAEHKVFQTHDDIAKAGWTLKDTYDPAKQFEAYIERSYTSLAKEQGVQDLKKLGLLKDVTVVDHQGNILGTGKAGAVAAAATGRGIAQSKAYDEARTTLNDVRAARGEAPLTPTEISAMQRAVAGKGRSLRAAQATAEAERVTGKLAAKTAQAAAGVSTRAGTQLLAQLNSKIDTVDKINAKIDAMRTAAVQADKGQAAKQLGIMVSARDHAAEQIEGMRDAVEHQARQALGIAPPSIRPGSVVKDGISRSRQRPAGSFFAPVVGKLQEIRESAMALPSGPARARVLRQLNTLGERAMHNPGKTAEAVDRHGDRMLKHLVRSMETIAQAGKDPTANQMIRELQKTAAKMVSDITRDDAKLYPRTGAISKPAYQAAAVVAGANARAAKLAKDTLAAYDKAKASTSDALLFKQAFSKAIVGQASKQTAKIMDASERETFKAHGTRFALGESSAVPGSPSAEFATARRDVIRFFQAQGAQHSDAHNAAKWIDGMNSLARIGMITNPIIHAGWNLGTHFLASGGNLFFMGHNLWKDPASWVPEYSKFFGHEVGGSEWAELADQHNAIMHQPMTHGMFGTGGAGAWSERNMGEKFDRVTANLWNWNQKVVFDQFEHRYAVELFKHFVENKGMSPQEAGIAVRHALGDYANVSRTGIDQALRKSMFFYGWMKSALPFWASTIVRNPAAFAAPTRTELIYNQAAGDPNPRTGRFFEGMDVNGQPMYRSDPGPWKYAADLLEMAAPGGDASEFSPASVGKGALKLVQSHLSPIGMGGAANQAIVLGKTLAGNAQAPTDASQFDTMFNKGESGGVQAGQVALYEAKGVPTAGMFIGAGQAVGKAVHGDVRGLLSAVGGTEYTNTDPVVVKQTYKAQARLARDESRIKKIARDDPDTARVMLKAARERYEQRIKDISPSKQALRPPPGMVPVSSGPPAGMIPVNAPPAGMISVNP